MIRIRLKVVTPSTIRTEIEASVTAGEVKNFAGGIAGQTEQWKTQIMHVDKIDDNNVWVEANLNIKLLNRDPESGIAVFRLSKVGNVWKLSNVEMFEVRFFINFEQINVRSSKLLNLQIRTKFEFEKLSI